MIVTPTAIPLPKTCIRAEYGALPYVAKLSHAFVHYSQRIQWLIDMRNRNVEYSGGLVFKPDPQHRMSLENQERKWEIPLADFAVPRVSTDDLRQEMLKSAISLCPTGNERISFRIFQIMATGSIPITTDFGSKRMLIMPDFHLPVEDFSDVTAAIEKVNHGEALRDAMLNKRQLETVNPRSLTEAFLAQLN